MRYLSIIHKCKCKQCKALFYKPPSSKSKFCSQKCFRKSRLTDSVLLGKYLKQTFIKSKGTYKNKPKNFNLTKKYLIQQWKKQRGICPFTRRKIVLINAGFKNNIQPYQASIDRIDNSAGYVKGNIRFVSLIANYARNKFSDDQLILFCHAVSNHQMSKVSFERGIDK